MPPAITLFLLLAMPFAASAGDQGMLNVRITITSQCNTQQALFGPQARRDVTIICQPGMTPFQTQSIDLGDTDAAQATAATNGIHAGQKSPAQGSDATTFSSKRVLSPPLPSSATFASKVIYVVF